MTETFILYRLSAQLGTRIKGRRLPCRIFDFVALKLSRHVRELQIERQQAKPEQRLLRMQQVC
jgi:hypothetical protein